MRAPERPPTSKPAACAGPPKGGSGQVPDAAKPHKGGASQPPEQAQPALVEAALAAESGGRTGHLGPGLTRLVAGTAVLWSLFQLWISSPLPFLVGVGVVNDTIQRSIHLAFGIFLAYLCYPRAKSSPRDRVPLADWALALLATGCAAYLAMFYTELSGRPGLPTALDIGVFVLGVGCLLEATRRVLGWPMTLMALVFLAYMFLGPWMPELIAHKGASLSRAASHQWLSTEGVFGVALGVSTSFVFLYVLFGAMLDRAGAGNYLTRVAFSLLGHLRGGPAKAAVLSSGLNGIISGSSVANVLTGGNVTIMLMKRVGYTPVKAGAIEVASSSNGQIMPPVMGAAAFLMVEYLNLPYSEIIRHAFLPAVLAYLSLLYIVHLEALKAGMRSLPRPSSPWRERLVNWGITIASLLILVRGGLWLTEWLPELLGESATAVAVLLVAGVFLALVWMSARYPEEDHELALEEATHLPPARPTVLGGLYFVVPIWALIWNLMVLEQSAALAAFWACAITAAMLLVQRPLVAWFRHRPLAGTWRRGARELVESLEHGARNMIGIAIATATAGIIVGAVSLTGIGQVLANVVETLSFGSLAAVLVLTALLSLVLGMGLPTTANYIVVSTLLAPVIVTLAAGHGMELPLIAVHLFVFYFGIMADSTPPVALAAYAAAGLSGADPLKTGIQGFIYELRTAILPFMFVFNTELLLIGVSSPLHLAWVASTGVVACFAFASATQGWGWVENRKWESALLIVAMILLLRPDVLRDQFHPPYTRHAADAVPNLANLAPRDQPLRLRLRIDEGAESSERTFALKLPAGAKGDALEALGLTVEPDGELLKVVDVAIDSVAERSRIDIAKRNFIIGLETRNPQPWKGWFALPGLLLVGAVVWSQRRRLALASRG
ncbi:MAG: TRAP transporter permease [Betaproteobacteria bacterium]|nr:TRAP transporter permease [Betaproteobacteria bacterium]